MEHHWLPDIVLKELMVGRQHKLPPMDRLLAHWLYRQTAIRELSSSSAVTGDRDLNICPAFFAKCFEEIKGKSSLFSLDELLLIAEKYQLAIPGQLVQEIQTEAEQHPVRLQSYLKLMEHSYLDWGALFPFAEAYQHHPSVEKWRNLTTNQLKFSFLTAWIWQHNSHYKEWWSQLNASGRAACLEFNLYLNHSDLPAWAAHQKEDRSKNVQSLLYAIQLKDKTQKLYQTSIYEVLSQSKPAELKWIKNESAAKIHQANILKGFEYEFWDGLAWLDPGDLFQTVEDGKALTTAFIRHREAEPLVTAFLHAALYHKNDRWLLYFMKLAHHLDLAHLFAHKHWPELAQLIPAAILFQHIDRGFKGAKTDMDKLDYLQYWLEPSAQFVPKEVSLKLFNFLLPLIDYIGRKEILLQDNSSFLRYLSTHLHPSVVTQWPQSHYDSEHLPSNRLKRRLNHRFILYKSLYEWQNQNS